MSGDQSGKPRMSLYANLLNSSSKSPDAPGTISSGPVLYKQSSESSQNSEDIIAAAKQKLNAAALRFQPTKRPAASSQKTKSIGPPKVVPPLSQPPPQVNTPPDSAVHAARLPNKTTIEDWAGDPDEDAYYEGQQRKARGGRKKRKKNKEQELLPVNWDDIYDPTRPNNYEDYKNSDERIREIRDWKDHLYAHRKTRHFSSDSDSEGEGKNPPFNQFAPSGMSFAPPPGLNQETPAPLPPPQVEPMQGPNNTSGEDAYAQRVRLSQQQADVSPSQFSPPVSSNARTLAQPDISRAPVRYNLPSAPPEIPQNEAELELALQHEYSVDQQDTPQPAEDEQRSLRPGQKGFAERLMSKYGWTKGSGLGAQGTGITSALRVKVEKAKRKPDSEGGGFVGPPGGKGKIIGGKRKGGAGGEEEAGKFGAMSEVVVLLGMLDGLDVQHEMAEGTLVQEIGEECGEKYGNVERVFVDQDAVGPVPVFVKFTSQLSGLRAVNALDGRIFNGNTITARFFNKDRFEQGDRTVENA